MIIPIVLIRLKAGSALECAHSFVLLLEAPCVGIRDQINNTSWPGNSHWYRSVDPIVKSFHTKTGNSFILYEWDYFSARVEVEREGESPSLLLEVYLCKGPERVSWSNVITPKPQIFDETRKQCWCISTLFLESGKPSGKKLLLHNLYAWERDRVWEKYWMMRVRLNQKSM